MALYWKISEFIRLGKASTDGGSMSEWECLECRNGKSDMARRSEHVRSVFVSCCPCNHIFHGTCILNYLKEGSGNCPDCGDLSPVPRS